jgi:hypothetical protein
MIGNLYNFGAQSPMEVNWSQRINPSLMYLNSGEDNPTRTNSEFFPTVFPFASGSSFISNSRNQKYPRMILMNAGSSSLGEDSGGALYPGWVVNKQNKALAIEIQDAYPRRMLHNLLLIGGSDGNPMPIAGTYFVKMMDHIPGTVEPFSCVILDENKSVDEFTIRGNLSLNGGGEADDAINLLGKANAIDCGNF